MKVLILSQTPWRNDNSFGSSYTGIFGGMDGFEFANIYCRAGLPQNDICKRNFYISEKALAKNLLDKRVPTGWEINTMDGADDINREPKAYGRARRLRWQILYWARDLLWLVSRWKSRELNAFIDAFDADILFFPLYYSNYTNRVARYIVKRTQKKLIIYISDDIYTLRQFSMSPLFWLNRFMVRPKVKQMIDRCELLYVISDVQKRVYERIFGKETKVLTKGADFSNKPVYPSKKDGILRLLFTGNIGSGRWKVLGEIAKALKTINADGRKAALDIYTLTPISWRMAAALNVPGSAVVHGGVSAARVKELQAEADILIHVESFALKERLKTYCSFSTKIVDYAHMAKCILAVGPKEVASIQHLSDNDAAVVAVSSLAIPEKLKAMIDSPELIAEYADKAWVCGEKNYQSSAIQAMLRADIQRIVKKQK